MKYPGLVSRLTTYCDGWIVGSAACPENIEPRDYDIWIPIANWGTAISMLPDQIDINRMRGYKVIDEEKEIDIFTCEMSSLFNTAYFKYAYHPRTGIRIAKV